jgi:hypothetical protein
MARYNQIRTKRGLLLLSGVHDLPHLADAGVTDVGEERLIDAYASVGRSHAEDLPVDTCDGDSPLLGDPPRSPWLTPHRGLRCRLVP